MSDVFQVVLANGQTHTLNDQVTSVIEVESGFGVPGVDVIESRTPYEDGASFQGLYLPPRECGLVIGRKADDLATMHYYADYLASLLNPYAGQITLKVTRNNNQVRSLACRATAIPIGTAMRDGPCYARFAVTFHASDPYFFDPTPIYHPGVIATTGVQLPQQMPFTMPNSTIDQTFTMFNPGVVDVKPVINVHGPCINPKVTLVRRVLAGYLYNDGVLVPTYTTNTTTYTGVTKTLDAGDVLTIDMKRALIYWYDATDGSSNSILNLKTTGSSFWALVAYNAETGETGYSTLNVQTTGATGATAVDIIAHAKYAWG